MRHARSVFVRGAASQRSTSECVTVCERYSDKHTQMKQRAAAEGFCVFMLMLLRFYISKVGTFLGNRDVLTHPDRLEAGLG